MNKTPDQKNKSITLSDNVSITYYTDPLCCWSWVMEPVLHQLNEEFGEAINWRYCMGGLLPGWGLFSDPVNSVSRPLQMGPVWMHAGRVGGVQIDHNLWFRDPPSSSYLACIAFKSVQLQSEHFAYVYLQLMRERCMLHGINISGFAELMKIADELKEHFPRFDISLFKDDVNNGRGVEAFRADMQETTAAGVKRFPTLIIRQTGKQSLLITGYRPYESLSGILTSNFDLAPAGKTQDSGLHQKPLI